MTKNKIVKNLVELASLSIGLGVTLLLCKVLGWTLDPYWLIGIGVVETVLAMILVGFCGARIEPE